jgi:hypothetical protein
MYVLARFVCCERCCFTTYLFLCPSPYVLAGVKDELDCLRSVQASLCDHVPEILDDWVWHGEHKFGKTDVHDFVARNGLPILPLRAQLFAPAAAYIPPSVVPGFFSINTIRNADLVLTAKLVTQGCASKSRRTEASLNSRRLLYQCGPVEVVNSLCVSRVELAIMTDRPVPPPKGQYHANNCCNAFGSSICFHMYDMQLQRHLTPRKLLPRDLPSHQSHRKVRHHFLFFFCAVRCMLISLLYLP